MGVLEGFTVDNLHTRIGAHFAQDTVAWLMYPMMLCCASHQNVTACCLLKCTRTLYWESKGKVIYSPLCLELGSLLQST